MVKFHIIALKCSECGSYNTTRVHDGNHPINVAVAAAVVAQAQNVLDAEEQENDIEDNVDNEDNESINSSEDASDDITNNSDVEAGSDLSLD